MKNKKVILSNNSALERRKIKICGMKYPENILQITALEPDYLGFIFYEKSKRNFEGIIPKLPASIKKIGVFVNEMIEIVVSLVEEYQLEVIQLHGDETPEYIHKLKDEIEQSRIFFKEENKLSKKKTEIIKNFSIENSFNFDVLKEYEKVVDYFLFDTKGEERGGNGVTFDWKVLANYPSTKPYFLSGGIGLEKINELLLFLQKKESKYCYAIDVNSKFEITAGVKSIEKIKKLKKILECF